PQHRRVLVNEWIAAAFLHYLGISAPEAAMVQITESYLAGDADTYIQLGRERRAVTPGWHFGSRFPGDPARTVVYDFLPDTLLDTVENLSDFCAVLAFDKWMGNADSRQAIFFRAQVLQPLVVGHNPDETRRLGFVAQMVDNGYVFDGPHWRLGESAIQGLYFRPLVYRTVRGLAEFEPWLSRIRNFPEEVVDQAVKRIPPAWLEGDEDDLERLLEGLMRRRTRVPDLIEQCGSAPSNPFPNWRP
ncbi:MAG: HipA family kinase, partial [Bryobacteraceae bacterium]